MPKPRGFRLDLVAAGIKPRGEDGTVVDRYSLRHTFLTNRSVAGVHPRVAQALARHASIDLTMEHYTDVYALDLRGAVEKAAPPSRLAAACQKPGDSPPHHASPSLNDVAQTVGAESVPDAENEPETALCTAGANVGAEGFEPSTSGLKGPCSTVELRPRGFAAHPTGAGGRGRGEATP